MFIMPHGSLIQLIFSSSRVLRVLSEKRRSAVQGLVVGRLGGRVSKERAMNKESIAIYSKLNFLEIPRLTT